MEHPGSVFHKAACLLRGIEESQAQSEEEGSPAVQNHFPDSSTRSLLSETKDCAFIARLHQNWKLLSSASAKRYATISFPSAERTSQLPWF
ncbi:hypothetical protein SADUNF_Sadunf08G0000900 [Salix dunnii]|uniref:Uncharacterized protein n=1 Tax=Salix dunnii TaxID=1413687 RepID=A0A835JXE6_9ROSI|nr:hypothetical protein SADUNF_Sadunf08G0000900 [Salix dunnii]